MIFKTTQPGNRREPSPVHSYSYDASIAGWGPNPTNTVTATVAAGSPAYYDLSNLMPTWIEQGSGLLIMRTIITKTKIVNMAIRIKKQEAAKLNS